MQEKQETQSWFPGLGRSSGVGNGNPFQYSCLENSMDREAWQATVHGVTKNRTRLSNWAHTHTYLVERKNQTKKEANRLAKTDPWEKQHSLFMYWLIKDSYVAQFRWEKQILRFISPIHEKLIGSNHIVFHILLGKTWKNKIEDK